MTIKLRQVRIYGEKVITYDKVKSASNKFDIPTRDILLPLPTNQDSTELCNQKLRNPQLAMKINFEKRRRRV